MLNPHYHQIWQTVQLIPQGKVACYGQIADLAGLPGRARLVGKALGKVPKGGWREQAVPWFRVIIPVPLQNAGFSGNLKGFR